MAKIKPFAAVRPNEKVADRVAALPYDVYNTDSKIANSYIYLRLKRHSFPTV